MALTLLLAQPLSSFAQHQLPPVRPPIPIIRFLLLPDLEVVGVRCVSPDGVLSLTVRNNGPGVMPRGWRTGPPVMAQISLYYRELDLETPLGEVDLRAEAAERSVGGIDLPGGTSTYITDILMDQTQAGKLIKIVVDSSDAIREMNELNNTSLEPYSACGRGALPDLEIEGIFVNYIGGYPLPPRTDWDQEIGIAIHNLGREPAPGTRASPSRGYVIDFVLSSDEALPPNPTVVQTPYGPRLIPLPLTGCSYQEDMLIGRISLTDDVLPGGEASYILARYLGGQMISVACEFPGIEWTGDRRTFYLFAIIDPLNRVEEASEENNTFSIHLEIQRPH